MKQEKICDKSMTFQDCELAILRLAVDEAEEKMGKRVVQSDDLKKIIITVFYGVVSLSILIMSKKSIQFKQVLLTVLSIPILLLFVPLIKMLPVGLGLTALLGSTILIVLLFGLLIPVFSIYKNSKRLGQLFLVLSAILFISTLVTSGITSPCASTDVFGISTLVTSFALPKFLGLEGVFILNSPSCFTSSDII